jgi:branched-chain amino acid transport system permease protein
LAGSLTAIVVRFVAPDSFNVFVSIHLFVGLVVGGVSSIGGAILIAAMLLMSGNRRQLHRGDCRTLPPEGKIG